VLGGCVRRRSPFFFFIDLGGGALLVISGVFSPLFTYGSSAKRTAFPVFWGLAIGLGSVSGRSSSSDGRSK
jgi:hypothetical protein